MQFDFFIMCIIILKNIAPYSDALHQIINGTLNAKIPGKSVRKNGKIVKQGAKLSGKVSDKENNVFFNKE